MIISIQFEHYYIVFVIFFNICQFATSFHRLFPFSRVFWACNNFARRLKKRFFRKKLVLENCLFSLVSRSTIGVLGINGFRIAKRIIFWHMYSHFWENGRWITKDKKIDFVFWRFFKIVIWRPMLKFCSLEDNRITYPKSIGSLGLCYTDAVITERKVTPWPCNNFAGQR